MHELFLCDLIPEGNVNQVMKILQGYCGMSPVPDIRRQQIWDGPRGTAKLKNLKHYPEKVKRYKQWNDLSLAVERQAYIVTTTYPIKKSQFGESKGRDENDSKSIDFDRIPGTLRWSDLPDSTSARQETNGRPFVELSGELGLHSILKSIDYRFAREYIRDGYRFVLGNVLFELFRMIVMHPDGEISSLGNPLPTLDDLVLVDPENKWCLMASIKIDVGSERTDSSQKLNKEATEELLRIKAAFDGSDINLKVTDRLFFDTRLRN